jgi:hypothetical protein
VDVTAKMLLLGIKARDGVTLDGRQELRQDGTAEAVEILRERLPVVGRDPGFRGHARESRRDDGSVRPHASASFSIKSRLRSMPQR